MPWHKLCTIISSAEGNMYTNGIVKFIIYLFKSCECLYQCHKFVINYQYKVSQYDDIHVLNILAQKSSQFGVNIRHTCHEHYSTLYMHINPQAATISRYAVRYNVYNNYNVIVKYFRKYIKVINKYNYTNTCHIFRNNICYVGYGNNDNRRQNDNDQGYHDRRDGREYEYDNHEMRDNNRRSFQSGGNDYNRSNKNRHPPVPMSQGTQKMPPSTDYRKVKRTQDGKPVLQFEFRETHQYLSASKIGKIPNFGPDEAELSCHDWFRIDGKSAVHHFPLHLKSINKTKLEYILEHLDISANQFRYAPDSVYGNYATHIEVLSLYSLLKIVVLANYIIDHRDLFAKFKHAEILTMSVIKVKDEAYKYIVAPPEGFHAFYNQAYIWNERLEEGDLKGKWRFYDNNPQIDFKEIFPLFTYPICYQTKEMSFCAATSG